MSEYIEREKVYEMLHSIGGCDAEPGSWANGWDKAIDTAIAELENIPAADIRPERYGEWQDVEGERTSGILGNVRYVVGTCSFCGERQTFNGQYEEFPKYCPPYCPLCSAKMDVNGGENNV